MNKQIILAVIVCGVASVSVFFFHSFFAKAIALSILAVIGGVCVYRGLAIERKLEEKSQQRLTLAEYRSKESESKHGWDWLMWGIRIEIFAAAILAAASVVDEWQTSERLKARTITDEQKNRFILLTRDFPKVPVKVFVGLEDYETLHYAQRIREMLDSAGYGVKINATQNEGVQIYEGVVEEGILVHADIRSIDSPLTSSFFGIFTFEYGTNRTAIWNFKPTRPSEMTRHASPRFNSLNLALQQIGLRPGCAEDNRLIGPGQFGILVPQKEH